MSAAATLPSVSREGRTAKVRLRVLTLTPFFPSAQNPAQGCFIAEPLQRLDQVIDTRVIAINPFYRASQDTCVAGSEWKKYYSLPGNLGLVTSGTLLAAAIRPRVLELNHSSRIRMIHAHTALPCGEAAMALAKELNIPFVVSVHGLDAFAEKQAGRALAPWTKRSSMRVYREAHTIVCISEKVRDQFSENLRAKTRVIYNGVDPELFTAGPEASSRLTVLSIGNLIPIKDHALLLRAFAETRKTVPNVELEIVGEGPERGNLIHLAGKLGIGRHVRFLGRLGRPAVALAMQRCAVFALPSRYEGLGCVYLEAMSCGKPAIGCLGQGIDEIIDHGKNGVLVPPEDVVALCNALSAVLQDANLRRRLGSAARDRILQSHTLEHQAQQLAELYRESVV